MYQGAMPQAPQRMEIQVPHIEAVPLRGAQVDAAIERGLRVTEELAELHDLGVQQRQELALKELEARRNEDFQRRSEVWGGEGSFYNEDGTTNRNAVDEFKQKWRDENDKIARPFWLSRNRAAGQARHDEVAQKIGLGLDVDLAAQERKNIAEVWQDNYQLELARGNYGVCMGMIDEAVGKGLLRPSEGRLMKFRLGRSRACGGGIGSGGLNGEVDVTIDGKRYTNPRCALMKARMAREGGRAASPQGAPAPAAPADGASEEVKLPAASAPSGLTSVGADVVVDGDFTGWESGGGLAAGGGGLTSSAPGAVSPGESGLTLGTPGGAAADSGDDGGIEAYLNRDDFGAVFRSMSPSELGDFAVSMVGNPLALSAVESEAGRMRFKVDVTAPECVQRVQAKADVDGEMSLDTVKASATNIMLTQAMKDPEVSREQLVKQFEDSGYYEVLGKGDAEVGKVEMLSMATDCIARGKHGTDMLNNQAIGKLTEARVNADDFGAGEEWKEMEGLNPGLEKDAEWEKPDDEDGRRKWFALFGVYKRYRARFNPAADGEADRDEFNRVAQTFYKWYMDGEYGRRKKASQEAARDWYQWEIRGALMDAMGVNERGQVQYTARKADGGYSLVKETEIARDVLRKSPPKDMGVDAMLSEQDRRNDEDLRRAAGFARRTGGDFSRLKSAKRGAAEKVQAEKEEAQRRKDERKDAEKKAERELAKAEREEERRRERDELLRVRKARAEVRSADWEWDEADCPEGSPACATVPREEWDRLESELGYDGSQIPCIVLRGKKIPVVGANDGKRIRLNFSALEKTQKKPDFKHGEWYAYHGGCQYSYSFVNYKD